MARLLTYGFKVLLGLLFLVAIWNRVTSLEALPDPDGDEAWSGVQARRLLAGEPFTVWTPHGYPISPIHIGLLLPPLLADEPALWMLRAPSVICGILAIVLTYVLGSRILDRTTALIASALLAALPVAIIFTRTGYPCGQTPLFSILLIYFAFKLNWAGVLVSLILCYLVHPTNICLLPVVVPILVVQTLRVPAEDRKTQCMLLAAKLAGVSAAVVCICLLTLMRSRVEMVYNAYKLGNQAPLDLIGYLTFATRFFLSIGYTPRPRLEWAVWIASCVALDFGARRLIRERQYERVALVVGLFLGAAALLALGGSSILQPGMSRYGMFLVIPTCLAMACLVRSLLIVPTGTWTLAARRVQFALLLATGWGLLSTCKLDRISFSRHLDGGICLPNDYGRLDPNKIVTEESAWTFLNDTKDPKERALSVILSDIDAKRRGRAAGADADAKPNLIIAEDHWVYSPLCFLAPSSRGDLRLMQYAELGGRDVEESRELLRERMLAGAYVVGYPENLVDLAVLLKFKPEAVDRWFIMKNGERHLIVFHLIEGAEGIEREDLPIPAVAVGPPGANRPSKGRY